MNEELNNNYVSEQPAEQAGGYCSSCGLPVEAGQRFCTGCGAPLTVESKSEVASNKPLKWYKFNIYFLLFASAFLNFVDGIKSILEGSAYVLMGLLMIALAVYQILTRNALAKKKKKAPMMLYGMYAAACLLNIISAVIQVTMGDQIDTVTISSSIISAAVMIVLNKIYYDKRADMFIND